MGSGVELTAVQGHSPMITARTFLRHVSVTNAGSTPYQRNAPAAPRLLARPTISCFRSWPSTKKSPIPAFSGSACTGWSPSRALRLTHVPMVWGSRSSASATAEEAQPWAKSQRACHRSRSRGVGARYMRSRRSPTSSCRRSRSSTMSHIPNTTATRLLLQNTATPLRV